MKTKILITIFLGLVVGALIFGRGLKGNGVAANTTTNAGEEYYQLTHDFNLLPTSWNYGIVPPPYQQYTDYDVQGWPVSTKRKSSEPDFLRPIKLTPGGMIDINGDGLLDIVNNYGNSTITSMDDGYIKQFYWINNTVVYLNRGNMKFNLVYKCSMRARPDSQGGQSPTLWYGDCADTSQ